MSTITVHGVESLNDADKAESYIYQKYGSFITLTTISDVVKGKGVYAIGEQEDIEIQLSDIKA